MPGPVVKAAGTAAQRRADALYTWGSWGMGREGKLKQVRGQLKKCRVSEPDDSALTLAYLPTVTEVHCHLPQVMQANLVDGRICSGKQQPNMSARCRAPPSHQNSKRH